MPLRHLHSVFLVKVGKDGQITRHSAGRFLTAGNHLNIVEDHHGILGNSLTEGPLDVNSLQQIHSLYNSQYLHCTNQQDLEDGKHPELLSEAHLESKFPRRPSSFEYLHHGAEQPDRIEFRDGVPHCNGAPTTHTHVNSLIDNVKSGLGTIRYAKDQGAQVKKMESALSSLMKVDKIDTSDLTGAFGKLRELVNAGHLDPEHERVLAKYVYRDSMVPELGNKFAYSDFLSRPREGAHTMIDLNNFKFINDRYGHAAGDEAIKAVGRAVRGAADEVGKGNLKAFRVGGDEFSVHAPAPEHAHRFARALRTRLEAIPPVGGSHKLSVSMGFGADPDTADKALYMAKGQKYTPESQGLPESQRQTIHPIGTAPSFAHSLLPGQEGPVPLDESHLIVKPAEVPPVKEPVT